MAIKTIKVVGMDVTLENVPGSGITRVTVPGVGCFRFDPVTQHFSVFGDAQRKTVSPDLPELQLKGLRRAVIRHSEERARRFRLAGIDRRPTQ